MPELDTRYRPSERLKKRSDFLRVQHTGLRFTTPHLLILAARSSTANRRFGITVSTKVGNAVTRNRIKRRLRAIYRRQKAQWPVDVDVVVVARKSAATVDSDVLAAAMMLWSEWISRRADRLIGR